MFVTDGDGRLVGVLTERDAGRLVGPDAAAVDLDAAVEAYMTTDPHAAPVADRAGCAGVDAVWPLLGNVPVIDDDHMLVGSRRWTSSGFLARRFQRSRSTSPPTASAQGAGRRR
ncbi:MAG: hypothetical protein U0838_07070 [Chloroflexota bacterium]